MENSLVVRADEIRDETCASCAVRKIRTKKITRRRRIRRRHRSEQATEQQSNWRRRPCHVMVKCLVPSLLGVVGVKYQAPSEDLFKTHPLHIWSFLAAIFIYSLIIVAMKHLQSHRYKYLEILITSASLASGVLSTLSLVSMLLPFFPGLLLLHISWAISTSIAVWPMLQCTCNWLLIEIRTLLRVLISFARHLCTKWNFTQKQSPKPLVTEHLPV